MKNNGWVWALIAFCIIGTANFAAAQQFTRFVGGTEQDSHSFTRECPFNSPNVPLWGFQTYANTSVIATRLVCFDYNVSAWIGGSGGNYVEQLCPQNEAVRGFDAYANPLIKGIRLSCRNYDGNLTHLTTLAGSAPGNFVAVRCPSGQIGRGIQGWAGSRVTSLGLYCSPW